MQLRVQHSLSFRHELASARQSVRPSLEEHAPSAIATIAEKKAENACERDAVAVRKGCIARKVSALPPGLRAPKPRLVNATPSLRSSTATLGSLRACIVETAAQPDQPALTVVLLHGYGASGDDLVGLAQEIEAPPGTRFVFPEAPLSLGLAPRAGDEGRAWWPLDMERLEVALNTGDIASLLQEVPPGLATARMAIVELLDVLERDYGARPERTVLGGFSQGAMLSLDVALRTKRALAGLVLLSGTLVCADEWRPLMPNRAGLRVLQSHGIGDPLLLFPIAEALRGLLVEAGVEVEWVPFRGGHTIGVEVLDALGVFLQKATSP